MTGAEVALYLLALAAIAFCGMAAKVRELQGGRPASVLDVLQRLPDPQEQAELAETAAIIRAKAVLGKTA